jgi:hypothetical protein
MRSKLQFYIIKKNTTDVLSFGFMLANFSQPVQFQKNLNYQKS